MGHTSSRFVPANLHIPTLREEFPDYCGNLNLDAIFEPPQH